MRSIYFLHAVVSQLQSVKSLLLYLLPPNRETAALISKYDGLCEEVAEMIVEINDQIKDDDKN